MEARPAYLGFKSDYYTHCHDLPPQLGGALAAVLCCAVLCCAVLCCAVLCCEILALCFCLSGISVERLVRWCTPLVGYNTCCFCCHNPADANYDVTDSNYEPFDPTDPWPCPGPPTHPPATDPGAAISFDDDNQLILSWAAPATIPSSTIFGYKVGGSNAVHMGWW